MRNWKFCGQIEVCGLFNRSGAGLSIFNGTVSEVQFVSFSIIISIVLPQLFLVGPATK